MNVADLRKRLGLRRKDFAPLVGCSESTLCRWEKNGVEPDGALLVILKAIDKASTDPHVVSWLRACATEGTGLADVLADLLAFWSADRNSAKEA